MIKKIIFSLATTALFLFSSISFSQTLDLGVLKSFGAYTGSGAVTNSGATLIGDVGSNDGIPGGFDPASYPAYEGNIYSANAVTKQAKFDLLRLFIHLNAISVDFPSTDGTVPSHAATFGAGETLNPGVYYIASAASIGGNLTFDGGGDPDAFFIIKTNGALTAAAGTNMILTGGAKSCNIYFLVTGAITAAATSTIKGNLFAKLGAVGLAAGTHLEGRLLSLSGALTLAVGSSVTPPTSTSTIPVLCETGCDPAPAVDVLGTVADFALFAKNGAVANVGISGVVGKVGSHTISIAGYASGTHIGSKELINAVTQQAADDLDAAYDALMLLEPTQTHAAGFINETIVPGVYAIPTAGTVSGTIILDAQGDPNSIFVLRFGGAIAIAANTNMVLVNGAKRCNIFWIGGAGVAAGAVNIGASSIVSGYFFANIGASNSGVGVFLAGAQFSISGAVNSYSSVIYSNPECVTSSALEQDPAFRIVKSASVGGTGTVGDVITYTYTVTNIGPEALTNVSVEAVTGLTFTGSPIATLAVGEVNETITATYTITQGDINAGFITSSANADGLDPNSLSVTDTSGTTNENDNPTITSLRGIDTESSIWSGATDNDWGTSTNWTEGVPTIDIAAIIPSGLSNYPTISTGTAAVSKTIAMASGTSLIASGTATLSGNISYTRLSLGTDWHLLSSPLVGEDLGDVISTTALAMGTGGNVGFSTYNNSTPSWEYYTTSSSDSLHSGTGYSVKLTSGDVSFTGKMPISDVSATTTVGSNNWNLMGNPYPSYIAMNNSADATNLLDANISNLKSTHAGIYVWDPINTEYIVINNASSAYDMSPGQAFFVNVKSGVGSVSFTEGMQSHQSNETFYRTSTIPTIELSAFNGTQEKSTLIKYFENTSAGLDIGYDAGLFLGGGNTFSLSTHLVAESEGIEFALQCLNTNEFETSIIPISLTAIAGSEIVFSLEATSLPENMNVYLEDILENVMIRLDNLEEGYTVSLVDSENGIGRFYLHTSEYIDGCIDSTALNYDLNAILDDGTCEYGFDYPSEQIINIPMAWSMFSTYMDPEVTGMESVLQSVANDILIVKDYIGNAYLVEWGFNGIGSIQNGQGYQVKALQDCSFSVLGNYLVPSENLITLLEGWNLIAYLPLEPKDASLVFSNTPDVSVVKDSSGNAYIPEWGFNAIGNMEPGQGYSVQMLQQAVLEY